MPKKNSEPRPRAGQRSSSFFVLLLLGGLAAPPRAQEPGPLRFTPSSRQFYCDIPGKDWHPFEEEDALGTVVHMLGPDDPSGIYRAGLSVRWIEKGQPGFLPYKKALEDMRRRDKLTDRSASGLRALRVPGALARVFEVTETRRLPPERLPSREQSLHHYVALIPSGESYFLIRLSSTRDSYLEYRRTFFDFLRSFKPMGYR